MLVVRAINFESKWKITFCAVEIHALFIFLLFGENDLCECYTEGYYIYEKLLKYCVLCSCVPDTGSGQEEAVISLC